MTLTVFALPSFGAEDVVSHHMVTGVREHAGRVWMSSLHEPAIAAYDL